MADSSSRASCLIWVRLTSIIKQVIFHLRMISDALDASPEDESTADHAIGLCCFPFGIDDDDWTNFGRFLEVREQWRQYSCDASVILRTHDPVHVALVVHIGV